ncbi:MAG TPA: hypothetical protein VGP64_06885 [Polyangia bacterium]
MTISLTFISAFMPAPPAAADQAAVAPAPVVAQAAPEPVTPPPQPQPMTPPPQATVAATPAPAYMPPSPRLGGSDAPAVTGPTVWGILAYGGVGVGARFALPVYGSVLHHPTLRDGFEIEFGGDFVHWSESVPGFDWSYTVIRLAGGVMWDIWLNDQFAFYPKAEIGYNHYSYNYNGYTGGGSYSPIYVNGAAGAMFKTRAGLTLRAEAGITGLALGVGWLF